MYLIQSNGATRGADTTSTFGTERNGTIRFSLSLTVFSTLVVNAFIFAVSSVSRYQIFNGLTFLLKTFFQSVIASFLARITSSHASTTDVPCISSAILSLQRWSISPGFHFLFSPSLVFLFCSYLLSIPFLSATILMLPGSNTLRLTRVPLSGSFIISTKQSPPIFFVTIAFHKIDLKVSSPQPVIWSKITVVSGSAVYPFPITQVAKASIAFFNSGTFL